MTAAALLLIGILIGVGGALVFVLGPSRSASVRWQGDRPDHDTDDAVVVELIHLVDLAAGPAVLEQTRKALAVAGVTEDTPATGDVFDPARHKAVHSEVVEGLGPGLIVRVERPGWSRNDTLIRAADVTVSAASSTEQEPR